MDTAVLLRSLRRRDFATSSLSAYNTWARQQYVGELNVKQAEKRWEQEPIVFTDNDLPEGPSPHRSALVIKMDICNTTVHRIMVDTGCSGNMLSYDTFQKLGLDRSQLRHVRMHLSGFAGNSTESEGSITLPIEIGTSPCAKKMDLEFVVVKLPIAYNAFLGRTGLQDLGCLISMEHLCMKFWTPNGIGVVRGDQKIARCCYLETLKKIRKKDPRVHSITEQAKKEESMVRPESVTELEDIVVNPNKPDQTIMIRVSFLMAIKTQIVDVLV